MLIPSGTPDTWEHPPSLSRRVNANSQRGLRMVFSGHKLIKKGEC